MRRVVAQRKEGTTQIIFPEKVNSQSRVSKYSTGVRVSHPTVWLLTLCCGMLLMSHSSRLDWSVHSLSHDSPLHPLPCWTSKPCHLKPKHTKPQTKSQVFGLFLLFISSSTQGRGPFPQSSDFTLLSGCTQITASVWGFYLEGVCLLKVVWCFCKPVICGSALSKCHVWISKVVEMMCTCHVCLHAAIPAVGWQTLPRSIKAWEGKKLTSFFGYMILD